MDLDEPSTDEFGRRVSNKQPRVKSPEPEPIEEEEEPLVDSCQSGWRWRLRNAADLVLF